MGKVSLANWVMKEAVKQETEHFRLICKLSFCGSDATASRLICEGLL
jgi:prolyl oligopeptidase PreP (S9A serine peptidase family)